MARDLNKAQLALLAKAASQGTAKFAPSEEGKQLKQELTKLHAKKEGKDALPFGVKNPDEVALDNLESVVRGPMNINGKINVLKGYISAGGSGQPKTAAYARSMLANLQAYQRQKSPDRAYRAPGVHLDVWADGKVTLHRNR